MRTILAMGQSNARGNYAGGAFDMHPGLTCWNNQNHRDDLECLGSEWVTPDLSQPPFNFGNNMMAHAASLVAEITGEPVRLILAARGGMSIGGGWIDVAGSTQIQFQRTLAILSAAGVNSVDFMLWHQGESDVTGGLVEAWLPKFDNLLSSLEAAGIITTSTPVVVGELGPNVAALNPFLLKLSGMDRRIAIARLARLRTIDGVHFAPEIVPLCGRRYVEALATLDASVSDVLPIACED